VISDVNQDQQLQYLIKTTTPHG